jgi:hypothetical protein
VAYADAGPDTQRMIRQMAEDGVLDGRALREALGVPLE